MPMIVGLFSYIFRSLFLLYSRSLLTILRTSLNTSASRSSATPRLPHEVQAQGADTVQGLQGEADTLAGEEASRVCDESGTSSAQQCLQVCVRVRVRVRVRVCSMIICIISAGRWDGEDTCKTSYLVFSAIKCRIRRRSNRML